MANPALLQKKNGKYLWFALLGLGLRPDKLNLTARRINLGPNMFDKPNKDAFYIVIHFLLEKLSPTRFNEAYRYCWPVLSHKADAEFRKVTCAWLREIMEESANGGPKVVASLFLSPGGSKFVSLMLHLARHVMLQKMKTFTTDDSWVPEFVALPASSLDLAAKRLNLTHARFLKAAVDQDRFLHEYQTRAQLLVKSMKDIRAEGAKYDELLKRHSSDSTQAGVSIAEKTRKVRSLWSDIDGMLSTTKEEQNAVASVLKGDVDQYILDGTDQVLKIPRSLLERIEQLPHQLSSGNVYEEGQLNLLCVLELTNHSLQLLREERCRVSEAPKPQLSPEQLQEKCKQMARALQNLHLIRQRISKEEIPEVRSSVRELEAVWDRKWMDTLKDTPLVSFLNEDPALGFLSPMAPLSFEPAADASYRRSVFSQYPASLPDKPAESKPQEVLLPSDCNPKSPPPVPAERPDSPVSIPPAAPSKANTSLDWLFDTPPFPLGGVPTVPPPQASVRKTARVPQNVAPIRTKSQILDTECDNLADQFADAVTTTSPADGRVKGLDLDGLLGTLHGDPFSTRKQLTRTPESLILDVKSSWRKAIEEDKAEKMGRITTFNDSMKGLPTPLHENSEMQSQQGVTLKYSLLWDTFDNEALDSPSGTGSSAARFSLYQETLPEMSSCDSMLSLDDEAVDMTSEGNEEWLIPSLKTEEKRTPLITHPQIQQAYNDDSFMERMKRTPECLLTDHTASGLNRDWLREPVSAVEATGKVFSLDLDTLKTPSPKKRKEYNLPKLITFSPIDDTNHY
ncbi:hypothetical protein PBY51_006086 [Eleginops maclovinus]|uniref:HAUS augmin-like complex subunit 6 N-terminal domain-containing protein n=1 Tax=Eleginops maclovinus TaxID=56733 RepID=A0AAN7WDD1_ELEMC|nr:hypothetical protein PBY51_006086 [Eleginops maclovinus]